MLPGWLGLAEEDSCWPDHNGYKSKHPDSLQPGITAGQRPKCMIAQNKDECVHFKMYFILTNIQCLLLSFFFTMRISENIIDLNVSVNVTKSPSGTLLRNTKNPDLQSVSVCVSMCLSISSWGRCDMKIWICIWVSSWTLGSLPWQWNTALEEVWPTCWPMVTWGWTGCSSRRCSWTSLRYCWDNVYIYGYLQH